MSKNEWQNRLPKSIHLTDETEYMDPHFSRTILRKPMEIPVNEAVLAHYRYPYKPYTEEGLQDGSYKQSERFKLLYSNKIFQKLLDFSFTNFKVHCL